MKVTCFVVCSLLLFGNHCHAAFGDQWDPLAYSSTWLAIPAGFDGALIQHLTSTAGWGAAVGVSVFSTGVHYCEFLLIVAPQTPGFETYITDPSNYEICAMDQKITLSGQPALSSGMTKAVCLQSSQSTASQLVYNGTNSGTIYTGYAGGDTLGVLLNMTSHHVTFYIDGASIVTAPLWSGLSYSFGAGMQVQNGGWYWKADSCYHY